MSKDLTVIIPAKNEAKTIVKVIEQVLLLDRVGEVIVINDGSTDSTKEVLIPFEKSGKIKLINNKVNRGKGYSVRKGISMATKKYLIVQDADLELHPSSINLLITKMEESDADLINGNRDFSSKKVKNISKAASAIIPLIVFLFTGKWIKDVVCGYKLMETQKYKELNLIAEGFEIEPEIIVKAIDKKYKIVEQKVPFNPRSTKEGKHVRWVDGIKVLKFLMRYRFSGKNA